MDVEKWKAAAGKLFAKDKAVKVLVLLGVCGICLIGLSDHFGAKSASRSSEAAGVSALTAEEYERELERGLVRIVKAITGEEAPEVLVTLEGGKRYVYAEDEKEKARSGDEETEKTHVILKGSDGAQHGLTITEFQPKVKGVVIVSRRGGDPVVREKLTAAVRTALGVSSAKVCVTDTG